MSEHQQPISKEEFEHIRKEIKRFRATYKFALDEISTKVNILKEEFQLIHTYNPIEHVNTRVKSGDSIVKKMQKKGLPLSLDMIEKEIKDLAGIRVICSFVSDIYRISEMIQNQADIQVIEVKDYIKNPKPSGYQSLHLLLQIPVFMSDRTVNVNVEMQIRTIAMDFWASLEHKIYYKYNGNVPEKLTQELKEAADTANALDRKMERINQEVNILKETNPEEDVMINPAEMMADLLKRMDKGRK
ncbi:GTP pyrophosphokinase [Jeotgalibacillus haloalkalitolerans]|uniref:GTP pyrophosphokinase family protein n=1 Tax=Jeotgalibacillus haloalkalitolerans TaxID=3104292 RepID=A0ABU5KIA3_9BACL|nr:GTP pyrophosphokinase family protein [Jeotgalibacillus sp. HH7-29]MDZ5710666.1 GTP pyrophosphokinase family protein [Jeotgalibacillus sp. HH7-29]